MELGTLVCHSLAMGGGQGFESESENLIVFIKTKPVYQVLFGISQVVVAHGCLR